MIKFIASLLVWLSSFSLYAAPSSDLWIFWQASDNSNAAQFDHSKWQTFLDRYIKLSPTTQMYMPDYAKVERADQQLLQQYLDSMAQQDPRQFSQNEQLAYWINLYNALTVDLILEYYPVKSITKLGKGWFRMGPWRDELIRINDQPISLHDIEHRILRPIWNDSRIHYTLNCASLGCPDLLPQAYSGDKIGEQLNQAAARFINQKKAVAFTDERLKLSSIFDWYSEDFGNRQDLFNELALYAQPKLRAQLQNFQGRISYHYDWKLNEYRP